MTPGQIRRMAARLAAFTAVSLAPQSLVAASPAERAAPVSYVESSAGLQSPTWDGGYTELEMGDVNGDGNPDLVSLGDHGNPFIGTDQHGVLVWFGNGHGQWTDLQFGDFGYGGVALGDVNGDGKLDIGYGIHHNYASEDLGDQILEVALGDGTGASWTAWDDGLAESGETYGMFGADFADVDADGDLDLASISFGCCSGVHVYLNQGDGTWDQSFGFLGGNSREEIVFGDVNRDGWPDLAVSHSAGTIYLGDGAGGFILGDANLPAGGTFGRAGVSLGDVNGDGRDDLAWAKSGGIAVWTRNNDGTWTNASAGLPASGSWQATQLWDMDGDGWMDVAAFGAGKVGVWLGNGAGTWTAATTFTTPAPGDYAAFRVGGDVDHNGRADMVLVADEGAPFAENHIHFYREASTPAVLAARLVRPGASAQLRTGSVRFLDWTGAVPDGMPAGKVSLAYSLNGTQGPWKKIVTNLPNNGRYQWVVPEEPPTQNLRIAVVLRSGTARALGVSQPLTLVPGRP
jgi:hypothetical protein